MQPVDVPGARCGAHCKPRRPVRVALFTLGLVVASAAGPMSLTAGEPPAIEPAVGRFLVARSRLPDPNFFETVVLLLDYDAAEGAFGVVVNRPSRLGVNEAIPGADLLEGRVDPLYLGGPVSLGTLIVLLHGESAPSTAAEIISDVHVIRDNTGLEELMQADPPEGTVRFYAGYAGWSRGQLEDEISRGVWNLLPGDPRWVFSDRPDETWQRLISIVFGPTV